MSGAYAIILARAGSKGVPGKNVRTIAGRPCIAWTIEAAQRSGEVSHVAVSSDDAAALRISREMGAAALERPAALATDTARVDDAAREALERLEGAPYGLRVEARTPVVILYANCPVRPAGCIDRVVRLLRESGADSVQTYQPVGKYHPWWTARVGADGVVGPWDGEVLNHGVYRRQDLPPAFVPDGAVLAVTAGALRLRVAGSGDGPHAFFGRERRGVVNPEGSVVDIDAPLDVVVAEAVLSGGVAGTGSGS